VYITRLFRLSLVLAILLGAMCLSAIVIGASNPTTRIVAQIYSYEQDSQQIILLDINRNLPIQLPFPVDFSGNMSISANGQRIILPVGALNQAAFSVWEIMTGRVVDLPQEYINCSASGWRWLADNRHVLFQCRSNPLDGTIGGMYTLDFETGLVYTLYNKPSLILANQWSPNFDRVGINNEGSVHIIGVHGENFMTITPQGRRFTFVAWLHDGDSVFLSGINTIERYDFATEELTVILDDFETSITPVLSPNAEWLALVTDERRPRAYALHLATGELYLLETTDTKINNVTWVGWSPDSQWVMLSTSIESREGNIYYLARPDAAIVMELARNVESIPVWSPDGTQVSYSVYDEMGNTYYSELMLWDITSFLPPEVISPYSQSPQWSPDGSGMVFIHYPQPQQLRYRTQNGDIRTLTNLRDSVVGFSFLR